MRENEDSWRGGTCGAVRIGQPRSARSPRTPWHPGIRAVGASDFVVEETDAHWREVSRYIRGAMCSTRRVASPIRRTHACGSRWRPCPAGSEGHAHATTALHRWPMIPTWKTLHSAHWPRPVPEVARGRRRAAMGVRDRVVRQAGFSRVRNSSMFVA